MSGHARHLIFVHIPKAAGTSLMNSIAERIGGHNMHCMLDRVGAKSWLRRNLPAIVQGIRQQPLDSQVYFGHFMAAKFARFNGWDFSPREDCLYATMLRDPLQRALSHFHFWKRKDISGHQVWERFTREKWSLERFLLADELRDLQSRFLWRFPLRRFHVVGLAERYEESLALLGQAFPALADLPTRIANANPGHPQGGTYEVTPQLADAFRQHNRRDYALYAEGAAKFADQLGRLHGSMGRA